jgi:two-component system, OmpR family, phosphate regulon sensor histidine kinase PhoR
MPLFYIALGLSSLFVILTLYLFNRSYVTGVKKAQETIIESLSDGVAGVDNNQKIVMANSPFEKTCGMPKDKIIGQPIDTVLKIYADDTALPYEKYSQPAESNVRNGLKLIGPHGDIPLSITLAPFMFAGKKGSLITIHNLSQEQQLEEMKVDFVSMAAHELRTPLTAIRGYASLLQMHYSSHLENTAKELLTRLIVSTTNLANLIDNLLSVSRIERNSMIVDTKPIDLPIILNDIFESFKQQAQTKHQTYTLSMPETLPKVMADPFRIGQVFINLIANAINYTPEAGAISINVQNKETYLEIAVQDSGEGIPPEALPRLFTKFFRVSGSLEQGSKGTGLGLYITKSIVEMHHGKIWAESTVNKGSIFTFTLPIATKEQIEQQQQTPQQDFLTVKNGQGIIVKKSNPAPVVDTANPKQ